MQVTDILVLHKKTFPLFATCALFLIIITSCGELSEKETRQVNEALRDSLTSTTETWNMEMTLMEEKRIKVKLQGSSASSYNNSRSKETRISGPVHVQVYDTTAAIETWVDADSAIYRAKTSEFELFGDVRVRTRDDRRLESEYLKWEQSKNSISTPKFVIITTPTDSIAGSGFTGTSDLSEYTIKQPSGRFTVD